MKFPVSLFALLTAGSVAASTTFTWSIDDELYYFIRVANDFKSEIEKDTKGRMKINIVTYDGGKKKTKTGYTEVQEGKFHIAQTVVGDFITACLSLRFGMCRSCLRMISILKTTL